MNEPEHIIKTLKRILKEIEVLYEQYSTNEKFESEIRDLYTKVDEILEKIENSNTK